jgi:3-mercaptopyruvate sulfurtransferase SseA
MRLLTYSIGFLLAGVFLMACSVSSNQVATQTSPKPANTATPYPDGARRVTIEELEALIKEGQAFIVDVRTQDSYDLGHIPNAKLIPSAEIADHIKELPRDKTIVTYCS